MEHRRSLEREFEAQMHSFDKEMEKLKAKHKAELEQKVVIVVVLRMIYEKQFASFRLGISCSRKQSLEDSV